MSSCDIVRTQAAKAPRPTDGRAAHSDSSSGSKTTQGGRSSIESSTKMKRHPTVTYCQLTRANGAAAARR